MVFKLSELSESFQRLFCLKLFTTVITHCNQKGCLLLLDSPLAELSGKRQATLMSYFNKLTQNSSTTILYTALPTFLVKQKVTGSNCITCYVAFNNKVQARIRVKPLIPKTAPVYRKAACYAPWHDARAHYNR